MGFFEIPIVHTLEALFDLGRRQGIRCVPGRGVSISNSAANQFRAGPEPSWANFC